MALACSGHPRRPTAPPASRRSHARRMVQKPIGDRDAPGHQRETALPRERERGFRSVMDGAPFGASVATKALDAMFLISRYVVGHGKPAIEGEVGDRYEKHLLLSFSL